MFNPCFDKLVPSLTEITGNADEAKALAKTLSDQYSVEMMRQAKANPNLSNAQIAQLSLAKTMEAREAAAIKHATNEIGNAAFLESLRDNTKLEPERILGAVMHDFGGGSVLSAEARAEGLRQTIRPQVNQIIKALANSSLGFKQNAKNAMDFIRALYGETDGISPEILQAAKAWGDVSTTLRERANNAGAFINDNPLWRIPQSWSRDNLLAAGKTVDEARVNFVNDMVAEADWPAYAIKLGKMPSEPELREYLAEAFNTIVSGVQKDDGPSPAGGSGSTANLLGASRAIFIRNADGWMRMQNKYADKALSEIIEGHVHQSTNVIALMESIGPNANGNAMRLMDEAIQKQRETDPSKVGDLERQKEILSEAIMQMQGTKPSIELTKAGEALKWMRGASQMLLGSATLTSLTDNATAARMRNLWGASGIDYHLSRLKTYTSRSDFKEMMENEMLVVAAFNNSVYRSAGDLAKRGRVQAAAQFQLKLSLLPHLTSARKEAFRISISNAITKKLGRYSFDKLEGMDKKMLDSYGITKMDWEIWQAAKKIDAVGIAEIVTPRTIGEVSGYDARAVSNAQVKFSALLNMEDKLAIVEPTLRNQAKINSLLSSKNSTGQELMRSALQFKGFPIAFISNHYARSKMLNTSSRAYHTAALITYMTTMGALAIQLQQLAAGKDPRDMKDPRFLGAALLKSGALGIYADFIYTEQSYGRGTVEALLGPTIGTLASVGNAIRKAAYGDDNMDEKAMDFAGDLLRAGRGYVPGAQLWYTKALMNHYIFTNLQDMVSPGYSDRVQRKMRKEYGQQMYWKPGEAPRAPDLSEAWQ